VLISLYYLNIRIFSGDKIWRRIWLANFFSADKNLAANLAISGSLGVYTSVGLCKGCEWLDRVCYRGRITEPVFFTDVTE